MKYFSRLGIYKGSTGRVSYNPNTMQAHSYDWYNIARVIDGTMYVTLATYSNTTAKHIRKIMYLFETLGIPFKRLRNTHNILSAIEAANYEIDSLKTEIKKPKTHRAKNVERRAQIKELQSEVKSLKFLSKKLAKQERPF